MTPSGYTLIEILIVMAVLAAMAAFTVPAMRGPLDKSRLRAAGRDVSAALSRARALAIREGVGMQFVFRPGGNQWQIQRAGLPPMQSRQLDSVDSTSNAADNSTDLQTLGASVVRAGQLPAGIVFQPASVEDPFTTEILTNSVETAEISAVEAANQWSAPITFRPNGRSEDAELVLNGARRFAVRIQLRGLTSAVRYSAPYRSADPNSALAGDQSITGSENLAEATR